MKLIVLLESTHAVIDVMSLFTNDESSVQVVSTEHCDEDNELKNSIKSVEDFLRSNKSVLFIKFSGREIVSRELGDVFGEPMITLSSNKNSRFYTDNLIATFLETYNLFYKENEN